MIYSMLKDILDEGAESGRMLRVTIITHEVQLLHLSTLGLIT